MSILTQLLKGEITFSQAAAKAGGWASALVSHDANLTQTAGAVLSDVKQGASNAVESADSALNAHFQDITTAVEAALEGALAKATGGVSVAFNPLISDGIDRLAAMSKAQADAWALEAKSKLAAPASKAA